MLTVTEAQAIVLRHARPLAPQPTPLSPSIVGRVLAEDVVSDLDMPPFDKSMMDGYAVRSADLAAGPATLAVIEEITAGRTPTKVIGPRQAARIMTGAPMPEGADAVVMVEHCQEMGTASVRVPSPAKAGQNIQPRARELQRGATVLEAGAMLRPQELGLLAMVGRTAVSAHPTPWVAVLPTGDEIVAPSVTPGASQIRNSNGPMLLAQVADAGGEPIDLGIARDTIEHLRKKIGEGVRFDVLLLSGGVSAGKLDLVPGVLQELGVTAHFHKIRLKPGKPLFFGTRRETLVFGLPGNPVSSFVCFELFVRPALRRLRGLPAAPPAFVPMPLAEDVHYATDRPTYHPAKIELTEAGERVRLVAWLGSPDLRALASADALILLPEGDQTHRAGEPRLVLRLGTK